jgi:hypothetical protein
MIPKPLSVQVLMECTNFAFMECENFMLASQAFRKHASCTMIQTAHWGEHA